MSFDGPAARGGPVGIAGTCETRVVRGPLAAAVKGCHRREEDYQHRKLYKTVKR